MGALTTGRNFKAGRDGFMEAINEIRNTGQNKAQAIRVLLNSSNYKSDCTTNVGQTLNNVKQSNEMTYTYCARTQNSIEDMVGFEELDN